MKHIFDIEIAEQYGINAAILLENIGFWTAQSEANEINFHDGITPRFAMHYLSRTSGTVSVYEQKADSFRPRKADQ